MADHLDDDERLVRAVHEKKPVPEIDFTLHTMEDGTQVTTNDRVCKGQSDGLFELLRLLL